MSLLNIFSAFPQVVKYVFQKLQNDFYEGTKLMGLPESPKHLQPLT